MTDAVSNPLSIFDTIASTIADPFWHDIFKNCAKGKFPKGVFYDRKSRLVKHGRIFINIVDTPIEELHVLLYELFRKCGNRSNKDISALETILQSTKSTNINLSGTWKDIVPKQYQNVLLQEYIERLCSTHNITEQKKKDRLYCQLCILLKFKVISTDSIIYENREIVDIEDLEFDPEKEEFVNEFKVSNPMKVVRPRNDTFVKALRKFGKKITNK